MQNNWASCVKELHGFLVLEVEILLSVCDFRIPMIIC